MAAAVPRYLSDFSDAPPGHRFGLFYAGWNEDWSRPKNGVVDALNQIARLPAHSVKLLAALNVRQKAAASAAGDRVLDFPCRGSSPFATGLGNEHPLENGFAFLSPYGLPYLPGSGVKGVIRKAAEELASGDWGDSCGWNEATIRQLFGPGENDTTRDSDPQQGALWFWDVLPQMPKASMSVEIMTPHHGEYYQGKHSPHNSENPNPISFLAVPPESGFAFYVECQPQRLDDALRQHWRALVEAAFGHAGKWLGFGAKTAVGYGRMQLDPTVADAREASRLKRLAESTAALAADQRASLPVDQRLLAELQYQCEALPRNPQDGRPIMQQTSVASWKAALDLLAEAPDGVAALTVNERVDLAAQARKLLSTHYKVEGKAEKALKACLSALRG